MMKWTVAHDARLLQQVYVSGEIQRGKKILREIAQVNVRTGGSMKFCRCAN